MTPRKTLRALWFWAIVIALLVWPAAGAAQNRQVVFDEVNSDDFPQVLLRLTVTNEKGVPQSDLPAGAFSVSEDGSQVTIDRVEPDVNPDAQIAIALVIDVSGSMAGEPLEGAKQAANAFLDRLAVQDSAAVIAFKDQVDLEEINPDRESDFTRDHGALRNLVNGLSATLGEGKTCLYDAAFKGINLTAEQSAGHRAVVVFTDGRETPEESCSILSPDDPIDEARQRGVPVFTIGLGDQVDPDYLRRLAINTGGTYQQTSEVDELTPLFQQIADQIKQQYIVTYSSQLPSDGAEHTVSVRVELPEGNVQNETTFIATQPEVPKIRIQSLTDGQQITGPDITITPEILARDDIDRVEYYLDDELLFTATQPPYTFSWDPEYTQNGQHTFRIQVYDSAGDVGEETVTLNVAVPTPVPATAPPATPPPDGDGLGSYMPLFLVLGVALVAAVGVVLFSRSGDQAQVASTAQVGGGGPSGTPYTREGPPTLTDQPIPGQDQPAETEIPPSPSPVSPEPGLGDTQTQTPGTAPSAGPSSEDTVILKKSSPEPLAYLIEKEGEREGKAYALPADDTTIGRAGDADIVLDDPAISRRHATVRYDEDEGEFSIQDLAATNPTTVNGKEVVRHKLSDGDSIKIGKTVFVFKKV